jgi:hypothetical protein
MMRADGGPLADRDAVRSHRSRAQHCSSRVASKIDRPLILWTGKRPLVRFGNLGGNSFALHKLAFGKRLVMCAASAQNRR